VHFPVAFKKGSRGAGEDLFPLTGGNQPDGDVEIDDDVSIVDTWKGMTFVSSDMKYMLSAV